MENTDILDNEFDNGITTNRFSLFNAGDDIASDDCGDNDDIYFQSL